MLRIVVVTDVVVLCEALVGLDSQVKTTVHVSWAQSKMKEALNIPDLIKGLLRF